MIRPSADLRNKYNELSKLCRDTMSPIEITLNGREDTVLVSHTLYHQQMAELDLYRTLAAAEDDVMNGRVTPMKNVFDEIESTLRAKL